jgi:hypothetical protein
VHKAKPCRQIAIDVADHVGDQRQIDVVEVVGAVERNGPRSGRGMPRW